MEGLSTCSNKDNISFFCLFVVFCCFVLFLFCNIVLVWLQKYFYSTVAFSKSSNIAGVTIPALLGSNSGDVFYSFFFLRLYLIKETIPFTTAITLSLGMLLQYAYIIYKKAKDVPPTFWCQNPRMWMKMTNFCIFEWAAIMAQSPLTVTYIVNSQH